jgi:hypothetical protein
MATDTKIQNLPVLATEPAANDRIIIQRFSPELTMVMLWSVFKSWLMDVAEAEIDFGTTPVRSAKFTVTDARIASTHKIVISESAVTPTGKAADEHEFDGLVLKAVAGTGQFTVYAQAVPGPVAGKFRINYTFS